MSFLVETVILIGDSLQHSAGSMTFPTSRGEGHLGKITKKTFEGVPYVMAQ